MKNLTLQFVINQMYTKNGIITDVNYAINAGVKIIQYADKKLRKRQIVENAYILSALCKKNDVLFIVQDYPDIATLVGADGVHLTQPGFSIPHVRRMIGENKILGIDFTTLREAVNAEDAGVTYVSFNCFTEWRNSQGIMTKIQKLREMITVPIIVMGDFTIANIEELMVEGIDGIALMSHMQQETEIQSNIKNIIRILETPHPL